MKSTVSISKNSDGSYQLFIHHARMYQNYITYTGLSHEKVIINVSDYSLWAELSFAEEYDDKSGYVDVTINGETIYIADPIWRHIIQEFDPYVYNTLEESHKQRETAMAN